MLLKVANTASFLIKTGPSNVRSMIEIFRFMRGLPFVAYTGSGNWAVMVHERFPSLLEVNRTHFWSCLLSKLLFYLLKVRYCQKVFMKSSIFQNMYHLIDICPGRFYRLGTYVDLYQYCSLLKVLLLTVWIFWWHFWKSMISWIHSDFIWPLGDS